HLPSSPPQTARLGAGQAQPKPGAEVVWRDCWNAVGRPMSMGCGFETIKRFGSMTKRPSTTTGASKGSGGKPAAGKDKNAAKAAADADAEDGSEETKAGRPELSEAEKAEAEAAEIEESAPVDKKIEELNEAGEEDEDPEELERLKRKYMVLRFWQTARRFWTDPHSGVAWALTGAVLAVVLVNLAAAYAMNVWNRNIFDALEKKDAGAVISLSGIYVVILVISVVFAVAQVYARMTVQRRWRQWLTDNLVDRWLKNGRYYQLNLISGDHKNPEYRIADDVRIATESPVDFATGVLSAFLSAATFIVVLWTIGGSLNLGLIGLDVDIPGFLVVAAVIYAVIASASMMIIGRRFISVSEQKNQTEAELRYLLTRLRENGESIALIQGEEEERQGVDRSLGAVLRTWRSICYQTMKTTFVSSSSGFIAPILPVILCAPKFLDGSMTLGQVMQA